MQSSSPSSRLMVTTDDGFIDRYQVVWVSRVIHVILDL
jgi:hypothetical protein